MRIIWSFLFGRYFFRTSRGAHSLPCLSLKDLAVDYEKRRSRIIEFFTTPDSDAA
jgi:hypothetical protein